MENNFTATFEKVSAFISSNNLEEALDELYRFIFDLNDYTSAAYHESLYLLGVVFLKKYEETNDSKYAFEAITAFASADNVYLAITNESHDKYNSAIQKVKSVYRNRNTKIITH